VRAAQAVAARRIQQLKDHGQHLGEVLADYFEAKNHGEKIRTEAKDRAAHLLEAAELKAEKLKYDAQAAGKRVTDQAEKDAADYDAQVGAAVRRLLDLGETKTSISEMTGLSQAVVRAMARELLPPRDAATRHDQDQRGSTRKGA